MVICNNGSQGPIAPETGWFLTVYASLYSREAMPVAKKNDFFPGADL